MIYPIPPETEAFCWFFFNGCCNSTVPCGIPPFIYVAVVFIACLGVWRALKSQKKEAK